MTTRRRATPLTGQRFGRLTVIDDPDCGKGNRYCACKCECGVEKRVLAKSLTSGSTVSCGCYKSTLIGIRNRKHGQSGSPEYNCWHTMLSRCGNSNDPGYATYGARGIGVCERWLTFEQFLADMGPRPSHSHTLDRIDGARGYEPSNVRWATWKEQVRNRSNTVLIEHQGVSRTITEWSEILGVSVACIKARRKRGTTEPQKLLAPARIGVRE